MPEYKNESAGVETLMSWSDFIKERCSGVMNIKTETPENRELVEGNILGAIIRFAIPLLIGNLFQQLYNTVDSYVVGNYVSIGALPQ